MPEASRGGSAAEHLAEDEEAEPVPAHTLTAELVHLPDAVVKHVATYLVLNNEAPGNALLNLLAMCGVCKQWRDVAREVNAGTCLYFDGLDNNFHHSSVQRFRKLSAVRKEEVFTQAACLLVGGYPSLPLLMCTMLADTRDLSTYPTTTTAPPLHVLCACCRLHRSSLFWGRRLGQAPHRSL